MARRKTKKKTAPAVIHLQGDGENLCRVDGDSTSERRTSTCEECEAINETRSICADEGDPLKECGCPNGQPLRARWDMQERQWVILCVPCLDTTLHGLPRFVSDEPWEKHNPLHATYAKAAGLTLWDYHRIADATVDAECEAEEEAQAPILVGCCGEKTKHGGQADTVYLSALFQKSMRHARRLSRMTNPPRPILIVSAFYGLLTLDAHIEPYDLRLSDLTKIERTAWTAKVEAQWRDALPDVYSGTALCGASYIEAMPHGLEFDAPLEGLGVGDRLKWLNAQHEWHESQNKKSDADQPGDDEANVTAPAKRPRASDVAECAATLAHLFPVPEADKKRAAKAQNKKSDTQQDPADFIDQQREAKLKAQGIGQPDAPQPDVVYRLTGGPDEASISRGDSWEASALPADWADQAPEEIGTTADHETTYQPDDEHGEHVLDIDQAAALQDLFNNMTDEEWT